MLLEGSEVLLDTPGVFDGGFRDQFGYLVRPVSDLSL